MSSWARCLANLLMFSAFSILFLNIGAAIIYYMSEDLLAKREKDENFRNEVKKNEERYFALEQASQYSETPSVPAGILKKVPCDGEVYFYFGYQQPTLKKDMCQVAMYMIKHFHPNPNRPYILVFFNDKCSDNYALWNFRETFCYLKLEQIAKIEEFIVVKPYFYHKTMDWMTFGTIPKFIRSRTKFIYSCRELCDYLKLDINQFVEQVPPYLYEKQLSDFHATKTSIQILRMNIKGQERSEEENNTMMEFQKSIKSMIIKPGYEINNLQDYEIGAEGVPTILKMLVFYFDSHPGLELEGIFRKSVSIDEENQTILQILSKNYDYLLDVQNPHIIANLIKRFFSSLKNPIFCFHQFNLLMNDQGVKDKTEHLCTIFKSLPELNRRTLLFIFTFFKQKVVKLEHQNKMSTQNIAICFAPCIFRSEVPSVADLIYATKGVMYCRLFITEFQHIFGSQEQREVLYRKSYMESKKIFQQCLDIGIQMAIEIAQQNQVDIATNRRVSHQYQNNELGFADIKLEQQAPEQTIDDVDREEKQEDQKKEENTKVESCQIAEVLFPNLQSQQHEPIFGEEMKNQEHLVQAKQESDCQNQNYE